MRVAVLWLMVGCAGAHHGGGGGEASFRVFYPDAPAGGFHAKLGTKFFVKPVGQCTYDNGRDARWAMTGANIVSGDLPAGFTIEDGAISGTPKQAGSWTVTVEFSGVTCAGTKREPQRVDVTIVAG